MLIRSTGQAAAVVQPWLVAMLLVIAGAYAVGVSDAPPAHQNPKLTPPPGSIAGTMKTLNEVEPRTPLSERFVNSKPGVRFAITQPGSYYLPSDLAVAPSEVGIKVEAAPVTIDLMGHTIDGANTSNDLIQIDALADRVVIRNGSLIRSGERGIDSAGDTVLIEMIEVVATRRAGISLNTSRAATVRDVSVADTGLASGSDRNGIRLVGPGAVRMRDVEVTNTGADGIGADASARVTLEDAYVADTGADGVDLPNKAVVRRVRVENASGVGIRLGDNGVIEASHVDNTTSDGIRTGSRCRVEDNRVYAYTSTAPSLGAGIMVIGDDTIVRNNFTTGGGQAFFGIRLNGSRNLLACNRNFDNVGFSLTSGNMTGNIITSVNGYNANQDPDANYDH